VPPLEAFVPTVLFTQVRFGMWQEILKAPAPPPDFRYTTGIWHYARGLAFAEGGQLTRAQTELDLLRAIAADMPREQMISLNPAAMLLRIAANVLAGELAAARRQMDDAVERLAAALADEGRLTYEEPPAWYQPVRQVLGAVLLEADRPKEAEAVYRDDLKQNPENGWSLYGLMLSLEAQQRSDEAALIQERFEQAWARADVTLPASRF
jgi:tetratricopeptide (TPR) repeat protein